ncbi:glycosyltransferase [Hafnia alvei]|uniref:GalNac(5)-diNacbac-PP-undecaprenol beta-1,3-glucosyltransferase n=1 Tax=Hafnia alvei TaxID=569 RepID=A0A172X0P7_HAFAL|nr:glycosyltransferase family 2 protein [Hafnia alvei]ANF30210.1 galNac(5)-diNacbac-PP-undecaprenol beta-1,3-glucosyltransferase [Hafnia alvei]KAA0261232.1 glycosyltransferase [Hafnia alvei]TBL38642.1 glycosyltransferase [Hafnia alvei]
MDGDEKTVSNNIDITVFTPTFNRGHLIKKLYDSLRKQHNYCFEWLVIDDGSTDNTEDFFSEIRNHSNNFHIKYIKTENGGKHRAINKAVDIANGKLFFIVDSDDYLPEYAIERIIQWENEISNSNVKFAGVSGNRGVTKNEIIGTTFSGEYVDASSLEREKFKIMGDKAEVFYTKVLRSYKFPEIAGENFITESVVWFKIASDGFKIRWFNEIICITEYLEGGLTQSGLSLYERNMNGLLLSTRQEIRYKQLSLKWRLGKCLRYVELARKQRNSITRISNDLILSKPIVLMLVILLNVKKNIKKRS